MRKQFASLLLLLVLVPLLNFGPAVHRLSCFGLHGDGCCPSQDDAAAHSHSHPDFHSHCGHQSSHTGSDRDQDKPQLLADSSNSDCPLCRFFAKYNAITDIHDGAGYEFFCSQLNLLCHDSCCCPVVPHTARGPPVSFFC